MVDGKNLEAAVRLRDTRIAKAWTQAHLAEVAGLDVRTVRRAEAGHGVEPSSFNAMAAAMGLSDVETPVETAYVGQIPPDASSLLRYVASHEAVEGAWTCTNVQSWLATQGWDMARLSHARAARDAASNVEDVTGLVCAFGFSVVVILGMLTFPLLGYFLSEQARAILLVVFVCALVLIAFGTWVVMGIRERRRRKVHSVEITGQEVVLKARFLEERCHVFGPTGVTTFEVVAPGRTRRLFRPLAAMSDIIVADAPGGCIDVTVRDVAGTHTYEGLIQSNAVRDVVEGWKSSLVELGGVEIAA